MSFCQCVGHLALGEAQKHTQHGRGIISEKSEKLKPGASSWSSCGAVGLAVFLPAGLQFVSVAGSLGPY